jgi:Phage integrase family
VYSPHSLRATTATLLLDAGERIESVQDLLDHKHITTTQECDGFRVAQNADLSTNVPISVSLQSHLDTRWAQARKMYDVVY